MTLFTILAASSSPVSREQLMAQLRLDASADAEQLERLDEMIADAVDHVQRETGLTLAATDYEQRLDCWPAGRRIRLEAGPVRGVDEVAYVDAAGVEQVIAPASYQLVFERRDEAALYLAHDYSTPALADWPGAIRIRFAAGYNDPAASSDGEPRLDLPGQARQAVIALASAWFDDRAAGEPDAVRRVINLLRVYR